MEQHTEQDIRKLAYELWLSEGKPEGSHLQFWREAEARIVVEEASLKQSRDQK